MLHKPEPQLQIITPITENTPFTEQSIKNAFQTWANPENWNLGLKILAINFDLNQVLFTWAFDKAFHSTFILIYTCKGQFYNTDIDQQVIQRELEEAFNDSEIVGDGEWDYTFNGISLVVTIHHSYPI